MVARDDEHVRRQRLDRRHEGVEPFERGDLRVEIAVFTGLVRVLVVHEEKIVALPVLREGGDLVGEAGARLHDVHADDLREAAIHRIRGDGGGA